MKKSVVFVLTGLVALAVSAGVQADTITWGAQITNGVGTASGTPLPNGSNDLILLGNFNISNANITANGSNEAYLLSHFTEFGSAVIGQGSPGGAGSASDGYWGAVTTASADPISLQGTQIFYWVFNSPTTGAASQYGIFTAPGNPTWVFPDDNTIPDTTITDLSSVPHNSTGILWGSYGTGTSSDGLSPLYNLAAISVPEPSTLALVTLGSLSALGFLKRKR